jgi:hypothetical protein
VPILSRVVTSHHPAEQSARYYRATKELEDLAAKQKAYLGERNRAKAKELAGGILRAKPVFDAIDRQLKPLREARDRAAAGGRDTKLIEASIEARMRKANKVMAETRKKLGLPALPPE